MTVVRYGVQVLGPPLGRLAQVLEPLTNDRSPAFDPDFAAVILRDVLHFQPAAGTRFRERPLVDVSGLELHVLPPPARTSGNTTFLVSLIVSHRTTTAYAYDGCLLRPRSGKRRDRHLRLLAERDALEERGGSLLLEYGNLI